MEWVTTEKLMLLEEMPKTPQGIRKKAKVNQWQKRKKVGVKGNIYEYAVSSLPQGVREALLEREALKLVANREVVPSMKVAIRLNDKQRAVADGRLALVELVLSLGTYGHEALTGVSSGIGNDP